MVKENFLLNLRVYARRLEVQNFSAERAETAWEKISSQHVFGASRKEPLYVAGRMAGLSHMESIATTVYLYQVWYSDLELVSGCPVREGIARCIATSPQLGNCWVARWDAVPDASKERVVSIVAVAMSQWRIATATKPVSRLE